MVTDLNCSSNQKKMCTHIVINLIFYMNTIKMEFCCGFFFFVRQYQWLNWTTMEEYAISKMNIIKI